VCLQTAEINCRILQQDGTLHFFVTLKAKLSKFHFPDWWIGRRGPISWPSKSSD